MKFWKHANCSDLKLIRIEVNFIEHISNRPGVSYLQLALNWTTDGRPLFRCKPNTISFWPGQPRKEPKSRLPWIPVSYLDVAAANWQNPTDYSAQLRSSTSTNQLDEEKPPTCKFLRNLVVRFVDFDVGDMLISLAKENSLNNRTRCWSAEVFELSFQALHGYAWFGHPCSTAFITVEQKLF